MITPTPSKMVLTCDYCRRGMVSEEFPPQAVAVDIAQVARRYLGWQVTHRYGDHYECRCQLCVLIERAA